MISRILDFIVPGRARRRQERDEYQRRLEEALLRHFAGRTITTGKIKADGVIVAGAIRAD